MTNKQIRKELTILYGKKCMLTGLKKELTLHHIFKRVYGDYTTIDNGAVLTNDIHVWLHSLEQSDLDLLVLINKCLRLYKLNIENEELREQWEKEIQPLMLEKIR